jgi:NTE family protein
VTSPGRIRAAAWALAAFAALVPSAARAGASAPALSTGAVPGSLFSAEDEDALVTDALWAKFRDLPPAKRPRVALVLGGGGARGLAHIGVLKVLRREKVPVDMIVGTSVGAVVGALAAAGVAPEDIEKMGNEVGWDKLTNMSKANLVKLLVAEELLSSQKMESYLQRRFGNMTFADLKTPFAAVAADLRTGEQIILREGSLALAARASATMPGVFRPVPYRQRLLVDGGIVDNVPTDVAKLLGADVIICVSVPLDLSRNAPGNVLTTLNQALYIQGQAIAQERLNQADVVIQPRVQDVNTFELWKSKECMAAGEAAARDALPGLRKVLVDRFFKAWAKAPAGAAK